MFSSFGGRARGIGIGIVTIVAGGAAASAETRTFFGFDAGGGESVRLDATPNADTARAAFFAWLVDGVRTETFESLPADREAPLTVLFGDDAATLTGSGAVTRIPAGTDNAGRYPISGAQFWESGNRFTLAFSTPQSAFGFYATDLGDFDGRVTLTLTGVAGAASARTITVPTPLNAAGGGAAYFALIETDPADAFTAIAFGNTSVNADHFGFDDFSIARPAQVAPDATVPEPSSAAAALLVFAATVATRRRRRI